MEMKAHFVIIILLLVILFLTGCAGAEIRHSTHNGLALVEHIDTTDQPAECSRQHTAGCYVKIGNEHHIWYSESTSLPARMGYLRLGKNHPGKLNVSTPVLRGQLCDNNESDSQLSAWRLVVRRWRKRVDN
jgi:hypothetical protein